MMMKNAKEGGVGSALDALVAASTGKLSPNSAAKAQLNATQELAEKQVAAATVVPAPPAPPQGVVVAAAAAAPTTTGPIVLLPREEQQNHGNKAPPTTTKKDNSNKLKLNKGRFSKHEKVLLFGLITSDAGLFHAFLHKRKERMYGTKSWMHEIANRYNSKAEEERSLEAIRHHLMFRKSGSGDRDQERFLLQHVEECEQRTTCTKCLMFQRMCVEKQWAKCGYELCADCNKTLPHVNSVLENTGLAEVALRISKGGAVPQQQHLQHLQHQIPQAQRPALQYDRTAGANLFSTAGLQSLFEQQNNGAGIDLSAYNPAMFSLIPGLTSNFQQQNAATNKLFGQPNLFAANHFAAQQQHAARQQQQHQQLLQSQAGTDDFRSHANALAAVQTVRLDGANQAAAAQSKKRKGSWKSLELPLKTSEVTESGTENLKRQCIGGPFIPSL